jgi:hypothetical protein
MKIRRLLISSILLLGCKTQPATLAFPDFPEGVVTLDLGQRVTIDVIAANDGGKGVTWTCTGTACTTLTTRPTSVTFKALGITGTAKITATSKKQPAVSKTLRIIVGLNDTPDLLCNKDTRRQARLRWS